MKTLLPLSGILTVLNTPFTEDDTIDVPGLVANIEDALDAGVAGFLVPAMASEVSKLSEAERELLVETTVATVKGRATVIGGASSPDGTERLRLGERCLALGCDGILASIPYTDAKDYEAQVRELAQIAPPFLMLQDWDAQGAGIPVSLIAQLFEDIPCFRCLKIEVAQAGPKYSTVLEATGGRLHVSGGWAVTQMIEALDRGVHAFMPTGLHGIYTRIFALYQENRRDEARALFDRLLPILSFSNQHLDISIHFFKRLLHAQGIYATARVRAPILPFDAAHERIAGERIKEALALLSALGENALPLNSTSISPPRSPQ